jgi:hypothetical protein
MQSKILNFSVVDDSAVSESELSTTAVTPSVLKKKKKSTPTDGFEPVETDPVASDGKSAKKKRHKKDKGGEEEVVVKQELLMENIENRSDNLTLSACESSLSVTSTSKKKVKKEKL